MSRPQAAKLAEAAGAKVVKAVSKKVDYLVAGDNAGSKLDKANALGLTVIGFDAFTRLLETGPGADGPDADDASSGGSAQAGGQLSLL
jgi:DNA ligase (NAD+)